MADYISQFTGGEIDRRLAKVSELEAGKQDKLVSGETIKTVGGQSILGEGNIPLTDQEAVKFTPQTLTDAQKAQALANIGAASEDDVAALADQKYEGPYATTDALPTASASTMGAIYLVGPDGNGEYDRYVTKLNGSTYTWESLGKTSIDLANYATKAEVGELEAKVDDLDAIQNDLETVTGLVPTSRNLFNAQTTTVSGFLVSNGTVIGPYPTTYQTYLFKVTPGKKVTVDQKTTGNRFAIWSFPSYPQTGDTPTQTVSNNSATSLSITLGNTENYVLVYINSSAPFVNVDNLRVYYGTTFVSAPSTTLITSFDATALVNTEKFRIGYEITEDTIVDFPVAFKSGQTWIFENKMSTPYQIALYKDAEKSVSGRLVIGLNAEAMSEVVLTDDYVLLSTYAATQHKFIIRSTEGAISGIVEPVWKNEQEIIPNLLFDALTDTVYTGFTQKNGITNTVDDRYFRSDFIPVLPNHKYRLTVDGFVAEYNSSKSVISSGGYQGQGALVDYTFITTASTHYVIVSARVNGAYIANKGFFKFYDMSPTYKLSQEVLKALPMNGKRVLVFGDSIVGNIRAGWPLMLQDKTGAVVYNCGFGGCRMEYVNGQDSAPTNPFAMCELVDAMQSKVYLSQDMSTLASADTIRASLDQLKTITGAKSAVRLTIGSGVTANGNIIISLGGEDFTVAVTTDASTAESVATIIADGTFDGWAVTADGAIVTFIKETIGVVADSPTYNSGSTGVSGTIQEVSAGCDEEVGMDKIDVILIAYGTNELGYPQDDENNPYNKETYAGATRYSIEKICTNYKGVGIMLLTPIYRYAFGVPTTEDSDTYTHPIYGGKLTDNVATLKAVAQEYKVPCLDMYYQLGINKINRDVYYIDGTHLNYVGLQRYSGFVAQDVEKYQ